MVMKTAERIETAQSSEFGNWEVSQKSERVVSSEEKLKGMLGNLSDFLTASVEKSGVANVTCIDRVIRPSLEKKLDDYTAKQDIEKLTVEEETNLNTNTPAVMSRIKELLNTGELFFTQNMTGDKLVQEAQQLAERLDLTKEGFNLYLDNRNDFRGKVKQEIQISIDKADRRSEKEAESKAKTFLYNLAGLDGNYSVEEKVVKESLEKKIFDIKTEIKNYVKERAEDLA